MAYDVLGVDINVKDYEFPPGRVPTNLDVLQYIESRAAKGPLGERIAGNVGIASEVAEEEIRNHWLSLGSGFEDDFVPAKTLAGRCERIEKKFVSMRREIQHYKLNINKGTKGKYKAKGKSKVNMLQSYKNYLSQAFFPLTVPPPSSNSAKTRMTPHDQFKGDELDVDFGRESLTIPDYSQFISSGEDSSSWLFPDRRKAGEPLTIEYDADMDGENEENAIGFENETDIDQTVPTEALDKSTQTNLCPCPSLSYISHF